MAGSHKSRPFLICPISCLAAGKAAARFFGEAMSKKAAPRLLVITIAAGAGCNAPPDMRRTNFEIQDTFAFPDATGFLARVDFDADRDGIVEKREFYVPRPGKASERVLSVVEFGLDRTGSPSLRLHYRPDGQLERSERLRR
jgi:hypothetical protein